MNLRFFRGAGQPPPFVSYISFGPEGGSIRIRYAQTGTHDLSYSSNTDLASKIEILVMHKIPFAAGRCGAGPAETVEMMIAMSKLKLIPAYIKISWSEPEVWEMREMKEGQKEWVQAAC